MQWNAVEESPELLWCRPINALILQTANAQEILRLRLTSLHYRSASFGSAQNDGLDEASRTGGIITDCGLNLMIFPKIIRTVLRFGFTWNDGPIELCDLCAPFAAFA